jgi:hypothetical protein
MAEKENLSWLSGRYSFQKFLQREMADGYIIFGGGASVKINLLFQLFIQ